MPWVEDDEEAAPVAETSGGRWVEDTSPSTPSDIPGAIKMGRDAVMDASGQVPRVLVQAAPQAVFGLPALGMDAYDSLTNAVRMGVNKAGDMMGNPLTEAQDLSVGATPPGTVMAKLPNHIPLIPAFRHSRAVSDVGEGAADMLGLPKPKTAQGMAVSRVATAAVGALGGAGLAKGLASVPGAAAPLLDELAQAPALQAAGAAGSTLATDIAQKYGIKNPYALMFLGMLGGAAPGTAGTIGSRAVGGAAQLAAPFRSVAEDGILPGISREVIAGKVLNKLSTTPGITPQVMEGAQPLIPGSNPTISQVSRDPGLISAESGIRAALDNGQATSGRIGQRLSEQNSARQVELDRITLPSVPVAEGGTPQRGTLEYATAKRDRAVTGNRNAAFRNAGVADATPAIGAIDTVLQSPAGARKDVQDAMSFARERLTQENVDLNNPETLYAIRQDLAEARNGKYNAERPSLRLAKGELQTVIEPLDNAIDAAAPGYRKYLDLYSKRSRALNQQDALRDLRERGQVSASDPLSGERILTLGKYGTAVRKAIGSGALGPGIGNAGLSDSQMRTVVNVVDDLDRAAASTAATMKPAGSDTFKNFSVASVIGRVVGDNFPDSAIGQSMQTIAKPLGWFYSLPDERIGQLLVEAVLDPQLAARLQRQATQYEVQSVATELANVLRRQTQGAAVNANSKR